MITREYEALVIVKSGGTDEELAREAAEIDALVKKVGGTIENAQQMGRRRLAFAIARHTEGHYYLLRFRAPTGQIAELERLLRLQDGIVRFMILTEEELGPLPAAAAGASH